MAVCREPLGAGHGGRTRVPGLCLFYDLQMPVSETAPPAAGGEGRPFGPQSRAGEPAWACERNRTGFRGHPRPLSKLSALQVGSLSRDSPPLLTLCRLGPPVSAPLHRALWFHVVGGGGPGGAYLVQRNVITDTTKTTAPTSSPTRATAVPLTSGSGRPAREQREEQRVRRHRTSGSGHQPPLPTAGSDSGVRVWMGEAGLDPGGQDFQTPAPGGAANTASDKSVLPRALCPPRLTKSPFPPRPAHKTELAGFISMRAQPHVTGWRATGALQTHPSAAGVKVTKSGLCPCG